MAQQKKRIFWIGFARICAKSLFCQGFTAKRNDAQKTQSMHYGSCNALQLLQKADRQPPLHEKGAAARISGVVRRLRPFCPRCPGASGRTPQKMHHACKAWCTVSTSGRFASSIPGFDIVSNPGIFLSSGESCRSRHFPGGPAIFIPSVETETSMRYCGSQGYFFYSPMAYGGGPSALSSK